MVLLAVILCAATACDWAQFRYGADHSGASPDTGIAPRNLPGLVQKWSASTGAAVQSSPAVAGGVLYVGSNDGKLRAFDAASGALSWAVTTGGAVVSSPAVDSGTIYVGSDDHKLYAVRVSDHTTVWSTTVDSTFGGASSSPLVSGGAVYVTTTRGLYAYRTDGSLIRFIPVTASGPLSPPATANGIVYFASYADGKLWAYRTDNGALAFSTTAPGTRSGCTSRTSSPAVVGGAVYVGLCPSSQAPAVSLFAYRADNGTPVWSTGSGAVTDSPVVTNGVVYTTVAPGRVEARATSSGALQWSATLGGASTSSPALANGLLFVGADDHKLYGFDTTATNACSGTPKTCNPVWTATTGGAIRSSPAVADARISVGSDDGSVFTYGLPPIGFGASVLQGTSSTKPTVARFGPDGRLYVAQYNGFIKAYTVSRSAANAYQVTATETIGLIRQLPNHDDDGTLNSTVTDRLITGMTVVGSASSPVLYVASSDPRVGGGFNGTQTNLDTNSGVLSRLTRNATTWQRQDVVRGLPRSEENHDTNALVLDRSTNTLYVAQGGNTNMGAPSHNFNFLPEYAYSAAVLSVDLNAIGSTTYNLPTLTDEDHPTLVGPFGGDFGKHQAKVTTASPVQVYAPGFRNPFSLVKTRAGRLYAADNGSNAGWGDIPAGAGPGGTCTNAVEEPGADDNDTLHLITGRGYYAGHANPTRGNRANTFNTTNPQSPVPTANPVECDARRSSNNGSIASFDFPTTGMAEYTAGNFADQMDGDLLVAGYLGSVYRVHLNPDGTKVLATTALFSNVSTHPIDVTAQGDAEAYPGTVWVPDFSGGTIAVFEPNDFGGRPPPPCSGQDATNLDEDRDGYTNADEIDNGTDPCSAADAPHDWNRNFVSDLNDPDDDSDGLPDVSDPLAVDPNNGRATKVPISYSWQNGATTNPCAPTPFPSGCPGGLLGLGFTGLMTDRHTNYANLYDLTKMTVGGAAGVLTVSEVPPGDAFGTTNTQHYAFQYGVNANPSATGVFTVHARVVAPFAGTTPTGNQSLGVYLGTGDQDNYLKFVVTANGGSPGIQLVKEVGATDTIRPVATAAVAGADTVDLYLTVDPGAATVQARYRVTRLGTAGPLTAVGSPESIPAGWLTSTSQGLALGLIATSSGGPMFAATWSVLDALTGVPS